ncbi:MAG: Hsp33 family molecular chaperone HslO [Candidatus Cloacimonadales bacterium]
MKDKIIRGITEDKNVRFFAVDSTETVRQARDIHHLSVTNTVLMGRALSAALILALDLKRADNVLSLKLDGDGACGHLIATANNRGEVKAYMRNPQLETPLNAQTQRLDIKAALGKGTLTLIKDLGLKQPYVGQVELLSGEVAEDLAYYFVKSEQIPTVVGLGVLVEADGTIRQSGGFMIQLMPDTPEEVISKIEQNMAKFPNLTDVMDMGFDLEEIIRKFILKDMNPRVTLTSAACYHCNCSKEKFSAALDLLERSELIEAMSQGEEIVTECHFCNQTYAFGSADIKEFLDKKK